MYEFVDRDGPLDDNGSIHESFLHIQLRHYLTTCVLTVKLKFSHVETVDIMAPLLCSTSGTL